MSQAINMTLMKASENPKTQNMPGLPPDALVAHVTRGVGVGIDLGVFLMQPDGTSIGPVAVEPDVLAFIRAAMKVLAKPAPH